ncbi:MAG: Zn-ribbon domain-containing OB-fold protein [Acidimicrobiia bacterium]
MSELPSPTPPYSPEAAPFWEGLAEGTVVLPVCDACRHHIWYPRSWCPVCQHESVTWTALSGRGTVYARTLLHKAMGPWQAAAPYVIAYVELDEGPRVLTNVVTDDPASVQIGDPVEAVFVPVDRRDGDPDPEITTLLRFRPTSVWDLEP